MKGCETLIKGVLRIVLVFFVLAFFDWPLFCCFSSSVGTPLQSLLLLSSHLCLLLLQKMGLPFVIGFLWVGRLGV